MRAKAITGVLVLLLLAGLAAAFALHLLPMPTLGDVRAHEEMLKAYGARHPLRLAGVYAAGVVVFGALPLPGAEVLAIGAGALFGLVEGTALIAIAGTIGACGAFLFGRWWLGDAVKRVLGGRFGGVAAGFEREGAFYLFALRLFPAVPFFVVNVLMGATRMRLVTFYWVSQVAMLPAILAYVNAGRALGHMKGMADILSPGVLASFAVIGILPLAARHGVAALRRRRVGRRA
ncbi:MAG: VTT domain-containing protein [Rhodospirillales bacterium]|nr:VTT domain-containing protein [Rhodospirillales bacterium]